MYISSPLCVLGFQHPSAPLGNNPLRGRKPGVKLKTQNEQYQWHLVLVWRLMFMSHAKSTNHKSPKEEERNEVEHPWTYLLWLKVSCISSCSHQWQNILKKQVLGGWFTFAHGLKGDSLPQRVMHSGAHGSGRIRVLTSQEIRKEEPDRKWSWATYISQANPSLTPSLQLGPTSPKFYNLSEQLCELGPSVQIEPVEDILHSDHSMWLCRNPHWVSESLAYW